jgi:hypothetical protein
MLSLASVWTKHPGGWLQRITDHLKVSILVFILDILAVGSVVAQENSASRSPTSATAEGGFNLDHGNNQMAEHATDERIIDGLGLFDRSDDGGSGRYSLSLDLENEDIDWSFEITVTMEF